MMLSKIGSGNGDGGDDDGNSDNGQLLRDIEAISKVLYLRNTPQKAVSSRPTGRSKSVEKPRLLESKSSLHPRNVNASISYKDKKPSSVWNWKKPLKALTHIGHQKFNICFFLHVHSIEGLSLSFNDMNLSVHWKRKDEILKTRPSRVFKGFAEFDETLMYSCCVYGSRSGPHSSAKYEVKLSLIYASVIGAPGVDMGKHWIDLTRMLPVTLEELEGGKSTGKWTMNFQLSGKAKGATLSISFGFSLVKDDLIESRRNMKVSELVNLVDNGSHKAKQITSFGPTNNNGRLQRVGSVPSDLNCKSQLSSQSVDVKICDEVSPNLGPELSNSINFLYQKLNEVDLHSSEERHSLSDNVQPLITKPGLEFVADKDIYGCEYDSKEFTIIEQGIEMPKKKGIESEKNDVHPVDDTGIETIYMDENFKDGDIEPDGKTNFHSEGNISDKYVDVVLVDDCKNEESSTCKKDSCMEDMELAFNDFLTSESAELESALAMCEFLEKENYMETKSNYKADKMIKKSCSLDELTESVATDFLNMLGSVHSPFGLTSDSDLESPRGRLLREFEEEAISSGNFIIEYDVNRNHKESGCIDQAGSDCGDLSGDFSFFSIANQAAEEEHQRTSQLLIRRRKAKVIEDLESEALMKEWGLNEEAFQSTPSHCSDGFGSPVELLPEEPVKLPPLEDGLGPFIQTKDGGYVRSMNPSLFRNSKNVGRLIMQVSCPVVFPAELGFDIIEILQHLASIGFKRLSLQTNKLMPLEDITGKTLQEIAQDAGPVRQTPLHCESLFGQDVILDAETESNYVTAEHLAPLAMDKIETMLIEGLKIQSSMSEEAPSSIGPQPIGKMLAFEGKRANLGWFLSSEAAAELQALDAEDCGNDVDRLLDLSMTLQEWLRFDAGVIDAANQVSERTVNILAAHHAKCTDFTNKGRGRDNNWDETFGSRHGLLGNNLTIAFMVLLRDPYRNYEPVGASMLALIQVQRSFFHFKPTSCGAVLERSSNEEEDQEWTEKEDTNDNNESEEEQCTLGFKITEVHLSGLNGDPEKMQHWGTKTQQQYGTRWLLASGMCKSPRCPSSKSSAIVVSHPQLRRRVQNNDVLWSISSHANNSTERNWAGFAPHVRNPNVIFS